MFRGMRQSRTNAFEHTISGLLTKRQMMLDEAQQIRDRMAEIKEQLPALDKTLRALGYDGDLDAMMPRQKRHVLFGRGELLRAILDELKRSDRPLRSREIAEALLDASDEMPMSQRYVADLTRRVGKALRPMLKTGRVKQLKQLSGGTAWEIVTNHSYGAHAPRHR